MDLGDLIQVCYSLIGLRELIPISLHCFFFYQIMLFLITMNIFYVNILAYNI